jgi:ribosomal protein S18 acetylase RimI-like enzyme
MEQPAISIRVLTSDEWPLFRELRLQALREAPYAFSSTLAQWQGGRDTEDRWRERLENVPFNAIAFFGGIPAGMVSGTKPNEHRGIELISMWVMPAARGTGVAGALVTSLIDWATERGAAEIWLDVAEANERAKAFYRRQGFVEQERVRDAISGRLERRMIRVVRSLPYYLC